METNQVLKSVAYFKGDEITHLKLTLSSLGEFRISCSALGKGAIANGSFVSDMPAEMRHIHKALRQAGWLPWDTHLEQVQNRRAALRLATEGGGA